MAIGEWGSWEGVLVVSEVYYYFIYILGFDVYGCLGLLCVMFSIIILGCFGD